MKIKGLGLCVGKRMNWNIQTKQNKKNYTIKILNSFIEFIIQTKNKKLVFQRTSVENMKKRKRWNSSTIQTTKTKIIIKFNCQRQFHHFKMRGTAWHYWL